MEYVVDGERPVNSINALFPAKSFRILTVLGANPSFIDILSVSVFGFIRYNTIELCVITEFTKVNTCKAIVFGPLGVVNGKLFFSVVGLVPSKS